MLEPHLASTGATTNDVGITFLVLGAIFMVSTPLAGMVIIIFVPIAPFSWFQWVAIIMPKMPFQNSVVHNKPKECRRNEREIMSKFNNVDSFVLPNLT